MTQYVKICWHISFFNRGAELRVLSNMRYETRAVLAGAYKNNKQACLTHILDTETNSVFCARTKPENLADPYATDIKAAPTCKMCLRFHLNGRIKLEPL